MQSESLTAEQQKRGLYILSFGEFWDRFGFFGTLTILVLYLSKFFSFSDSQSYSLYGVYVALSFATPVIGGFLADRFIFSAIGVFIGLVVFLKNKQHFASRTSILSRLNLRILVFGLIFAGCFLISFPFFHPHGFGGFLVIFSIATLIVIIFTATKYSATERNRIFALLVLILFCIFFFAASLQVGSSITLFVNRHIDRVIFGWKIPTMVFSSLDPLFVVLTAPIFALIWKYLAQRNKAPSVAIKLFWGLLIGSLGFICFVFAAHNNHIKYYSWFWLMLGYLFLGAGEMCLTPALLSAISRLSPENLRATMIGVCFLALACAGFLSGIIPKIGSHPFIIVALITAIAGLVLLVFTPLLSRQFK